MPYTFTANIVAAALAPGTPPPGSNDWSCRPTAAHPYPVVLVHGLFANMTDNWQTMSPLLANNGYCVFALTYGNDAGAPAPLDEVGGLAPMEQSGAELARVRGPRPRRDRRRARSTSSVTPKARRCPTTTSSTSAARRRSHDTWACPASSTAPRCTVSARSRPTFAALFPQFAPGDDRALRVVSAVPGGIGLHQQDRGPRSGARCRLHEHLDPLRRAREPLHEQLPRRPERHEHHPAGPLHGSTSATTSRSSRARSPASTS